MSASDDFFAAVRSGDRARAEQLLEAEPALASSRDGSFTALLLAVYHGQRDLAKLIAARRDDLSLPEACAIGDEETADRLLAADRESIDRPSDDGYHPVGLAIFFGNAALARKLVEEGANVTLHSQNDQRVAPVHAAAAVRDHEMMKLILDRGADPNARQQSDYTPMHTAASRGDMEMAQLLLAHGADGGARGSDGKTPADVAREHDQTNFAEWITYQG